MGVGVGVGAGVVVLVVVDAAVDVTVPTVPDAVGPKSYEDTVSVP